MHRYTAYGLTIDSTMTIPELAARRPGAADADVSIEFGDVPHTVEEPTHDAGKARIVSAHEMVYAREGWGRFLVSDGRRIVIAPDPGADDRLWRLSLLGPALGLLLIQRGHLVLHGGAVAFPGGAAIILGASGTGKSTLTTELCRHGGGLLTDDVVAISSVDSTALVMPGIPFVKLWPDAGPALPDTIETRVVHPDFDKLGHRLDDAVLAGPTPPGRLFVLALGSGSERRPLAGAQAFEAAMAGLFASRYGEAFVSALDRMQLMRQVTALLNRTPTEVLVRSRGLDQVPGTAQMIATVLGANVLDNGADHNPRGRSR